MTETHLHIATDESPIPLTKKGNPKVGKFDNSTDFTDPGCTDKVEYTIPIPDGCNTDDNVTIAAHVAVQEPTFRYESAWGNGYDFEGKSWAMYFTYTI
ncbi:MAG: hypothetical protein HF976_08620 [ANME-2 cluster archaeon]|nr:hypothetical protein [ANME-2 cluster archaeon]MBC2701459.1 hypothetical protein [ANME-2 cluster archaeon]